MSDIFVVGSAGFIGSNITNYLIQHYPKYHVASLDSLQFTNLDRLMPSINAKNRHTFYLNKLEDYELLGKICWFEKPKVLIYSAASELFVTPWHRHVEHIEYIADQCDLEKIIITGYWKDPKDLFELSQPAIKTKKTCKVYFMPAQIIFGHRQRPNSVLSIGKLIWDLKQGRDSSIDKQVNDALFDFIYIKDYFGAIMDAIDGKYGDETLLPVFSGTTTSLSECRFFLKSLLDGRVEELKISKTALPTGSCIVRGQCELASALEHTMSWYAANGWIWNC